MIEYVSADVRVDSGERVVEQVEVSVLVYGASHADALLLPAADVDALRSRVILSCWKCRRSSP